MTTERDLAEKPYVRLFIRWYPLVVFAVGVFWVLTRARDRFVDDEWRYVWYAKNLLRGYYSPLDGNEMVWNGPGYPLWLVPFIAAGLPLIVPKLANAALLALAARHVDRTVRLYASPVRAALGGLVLGLSPLSYQNLHKVHTETMAVFLAAGLVYHFCASRAADAPAPDGPASRSGDAAAPSASRRRHALLAGAYFGALALTKVSFGPLLFLAVAASLAAWAFRRRQWPMARNALATALVGLAICLPWLHYAYRMSGRPLYWASGGGQTIYWMAAPFDEELGDWHHHGEVQKIPILRKHHGQFYRELIGDLSQVAGTELERALPGAGRYCGIEADAAFYRRAFAYLRESPGHYLRHCFFNVGRLFFDYPYTFHNRHHPWALIVLHVLMVGTAIAVAARRLLGRLKLPPEIEIVALFTLVATALSIGLSAVGRYFLALYPAYLLVTLVGTAPERWHPAKPDEDGAEPSGKDAVEEDVVAHTD